MTTLITRILLVAPFALLLAAAFAIALCVEAVSDIAGGTHPSGRAS